jgi:hypothetical protein
MAVVPEDLIALYQIETLTKISSQASGTTAILL